MTDAEASPPRAAWPGDRLTLIGAGHVFDIRAAIRGAIEALRPDVVFLELDQGRLQTLLQRDRGGLPPEATGFIHRRMAKFQEGVAGMYGAEVGSEMLGAVDGARAVGARIVLVDGDAGAALGRVRREMRFGEKLRFVGMALGGAVKGLVPGRSARNEIEGELARYQNDPAQVLGELGAKFPTIHRILIAERDAAMAERIRATLTGGAAKVVFGASGSTSPSLRGVAVLGDGHVGGMSRILADLRPRVYRLADVREGRLPRAWHAVGTTTNLRFWVPARVNAL